MTSDWGQFVAKVGSSRAKEGEVGDANVDYGAINYDLIATDVAEIAPASINVVGLIEEHGGEYDKYSIEERF